MVTPEGRWHPSQENIRTARAFHRDAFRYLDHEYSRSGGCAWCGAGGHGASDCRLRRQSEAELVAEARHRQHAHA